MCWSTKIVYHKNAFIVQNVLIKNVKPVKLVIICTKLKENVIKYVLMGILEIIKLASVRYVWIIVLNAQVLICVINVKMDIILLELFVLIKPIFNMEPCLICLVLQAISLILLQRYT